MNNVMRVNKVKVIRDFPGFDKGSVLKRYKRDIFGDDTFILDVGDEGVNISDLSWRLKEAQIEKYMGKYFEDITERIMKTREEIREVIKDFEEAYKSEVDDSYALVAYQNIINALEWVVGDREYLK